MLLFPSVSRLGFEGFSSMERSTSGLGRESAERKHLPKVLPPPRRLENGRARIKPFAYKRKDG